MTAPLGIPADPATPFAGGRRVLRAGGLAAVAGGALHGLVALFAPRQAAFGYLTAWIFVLSVVLGTLAFTMIVHAMGARWPVLLRRLAEAVTGTLPVLAVLSLPVMLQLRWLYPWAGARPPREHELARVLTHQRPYLNVPFFVGRAALYLALWLAVSILLRRWSLRQDGSGAPSLDTSQRVLSAAALPAMGLSLTFAAFDWLMSLKAGWFSSIFGIYWFAGAILAAIACLTLMAAAADRAGPLTGLIGRSHYYALGRLLLTFVVFWAYVAFFQFFIIWIADKPSEVGWYLDRGRGRWAWVTGALAAGHFVLPFLALLPYRTKQRAAPLVVLASWLLVFHLVDTCWLVLPACGRGLFPAGLLATAGALLLVGGITVMTAILCLRGRAAVPCRAPQLADALRYHSE